MRYIDLKEGEGKTLTPALYQEILKQMHPFLPFLYKRIPVSGAFHQKSLAFRGMEIENLDFLCYFPGLESLIIADNHKKLRNIEGLRYTLRLKNLIFPDSPILSSTPLKKCYTLTTLNVSGIFSAGGNLDVLDLSELTGLRRFYSANNELEQIDFIKNWINLKDLDISGNRITDISLLENMPELEEVDIQGNPITDDSVLKKCTKLKEQFVYTDKEI